MFFFFSSRRRHTRFALVSWARRCVDETALYPITIRNDGNHDALNVDIEVRLDSITGQLLHEETIDVQSNSIKNLEEFNWIAEGQGNHDIWVMCIIDENENEEVRYDNNNVSKPIDIRPEYGVELTADSIIQNTNSDDHCRHAEADKQRHLILRIPGAGKLRISDQFLA